MPDGILTLDPGSRFWFEGEVWEVDCFLGDTARLRRGSTVRQVSTSALLAGASSLDDTPSHGERDVFTLPAVMLASLSAKQHREVSRRLEELRPLLEAATDGASRSLRITARAQEVGVSARTLERRLERFEALGPAGLADARLDLVHAQLRSWRYLTSAAEPPDLMARALQAAVFVTSQHTPTATRAAANRLGLLGPQDPQAPIGPAHLIRSRPHSRPLETSVLLALRGRLSIDADLHLRLGAPLPSYPGQLGTPTTTGTYTPIKAWPSCPCHRSRP